MTSKMDAFFASQNMTINPNETFSEITAYLTQTYLHPQTKFYSFNHAEFLNIYEVFCIDESGVSSKLLSAEVLKLILFSGFGADYTMS